MEWGTPCRVEREGGGGRGESGPRQADRRAERQRGRVRESGSGSDRGREAAAGLCARARARATSGRMWARFRRRCRHARAIVSQPPPPPRAGRPLPRRRANWFFLPARAARIAAASLWAAYCPVREDGQNGHRPAIDPLAQESPFRHCILLRSTYSDISQKPANLECIAQVQLQFSRSRKKRRVWVWV